MRLSTRSSRNVRRPLEPWEKSEPLSLARYGQGVRQVEGFAELWRGLKPKNSGQSATDLAWHLIKHCPNSLFHLEMNTEYFRSDALFSLALDILPRVNTLSIAGGCYVRDLLSFSKFMRVITTTSVRLCSLSLSTLRFHSVQESDAEAVPTSIPDPEFTARPKQLKVSDLDRDKDWLWLWRAYDRVKELALGELSIDVVETVVKLVQNCMPCLDLVEFCCNCYTDQNEDEDEEKGEDDEIRSILAAGAKDWKAVRFGADVAVGP